MKKIGLGIMNCIDNKKTVNFIRNAYDYGIKYYETSPFYNNGNCETIMSEALSLYDHNTYELCAKYDNIDKKITDDYFYNQLKRNGVEYFDTYLIQCVRRDRIPSDELINFLLQKKQQGFIKKLGFSFHDRVNIIEQVFKIYSNWDIIQLRINYHDWYINIGIQEVYNFVYSYNIPITVMGPLNGGLLSHPDDIHDLKRCMITKWDYSQIALRFFNILPGVDRILTGATSMEELIKNTQAIESDGFNKSEEIFCKSMVNNFKQKKYINCIYCKYCESRCMARLKISEYFKAYNDILNNKNKDKYVQLIQNEPGKQCINCGKCEQICPQHLDIRKYLHEYLYQTRV